MSFCSSIWVVIAVGRREGDRIGQVESREKRMEEVRGKGAKKVSK